MPTPAPTSSGLLAIPHELAAEQFAVVLRRLANDMTFGIDASRFVGSGVDYAQTRLYQGGDAIRSIDWRVTARTGSVHVKEFESTKRSAIYLLVDTSASMRASSQPLTKHDAAVWIAGALALVGLRRRSPVAIMGCGARSRGSGEGAEPTLSRGRLWQWLERLRESQGFDAEGTILADKLTQVETVSPHVASVIVISDLHEAGSVPAIRRVAQKHDVTVFQLQDPAELAPLRAGFVRARGAESDDELLLTSRSRLVGPMTGHDPAAELAGASFRHAVLSTADHGRHIIPQIRRVLGQRSLTRGGR